MAVQAQYIVVPAAAATTTTTHLFNHPQQGDQQHQIPHGLTTFNASTASRKRNRQKELSQFLIIPPIIMNNNQQQEQRINRLSGSPAMEIDALIRLHSAKLRSGVDEIQKRHCSQMVSIIENQAAKRLTEKETEIESAKRRQTELEVKLRQLTAENQIWYTIAKNSEAVISGLRAHLDQVLRQNAQGHVAAEEQVADAESCCFEGGEDEVEERDRQRGGGSVVCRVCGENHVSVLVLPCRHLCLCRECEAMTATCPICEVPKKVGLQVFME